MPGNDVGYCKRLARTGDPEQSLVGVRLEPLEQVIDGLRLVALGLEIGVQLKHLSPFSGTFCSPETAGRIDPNHKYSQFDGGGNH